MTSEKMAELIQSDREEFKELIPILWKKSSSYIFKVAYAYYSSHSLVCAKRGVELEDLKAGCYQAFLNALNDYDPNKEFTFVSYMRTRFRDVAKEMLNVKTKRGFLDPLNSYVPLDAPIQNRQHKSEESETTIAAFIPADEPSVDSIIDEKLVDIPRRKKENAAIRDAVKKLPQKCRLVIFLHYYDEFPLIEVAKRMNVNSQMLKSLKKTALDCLKRDPSIQEIYHRNFADSVTARDENTSVSTLSEWAERERARRRRMTADGSEV